MSAINAILSLNAVGAQDQTAANWNFCLRLSAGYSDAPDLSSSIAARQNLAAALLPWILFQKPGLRAFIVDPTGASQPVIRDLAVDPPDSFPDSPGAPIVKGFSSNLRDDISTQLNILVASDTNNTALDYKWTPTSSSVVSNNGSASNKLSLPGLLKTLAALPPGLSQALRAAWYFKVPAAWLTAGLSKNPKLHFLVVPLNLMDTRTPPGLVYSLNADSKINSIANGVYQINYGAPANPEATATGYALSISDLPGDMPYWLKVNDARGKTVSDIDQKIAQCLDLINLITSVKAEDLAGFLAIKPSVATQPVPTNLEIAQYLLANAPVDTADWKRPDPQQPDYTAILQQRQKAVTAFLNQLSSIPPNTDPVQWLQGRAKDKIATWWEFDWNPQSPAGTGQWQMDLLTDANSKALIPNLTNVLYVELQDATALAADLVSRVFSSAPTTASNGTRPSLPNEGFDLQLGDPDNLLVHAGSFENTADEAQLASAGLLVRRSPDKAGLSGKPWRLVTAGIPVIDPDQKLSGTTNTPGRPFGSLTLARQPEVPNTGAPMPGGISLDFINGVRRSELTYRGENPRLQSPAAFVHRQTLQTGQSASQVNSQLIAKPRLSTHSFQLPGSLGRTVPNAASTLATPLRYGDYYEFCSFVIDRAFGLPKELSQPSALSAGADGYCPDFNWGALGTFVPDPKKSYSSGSLQFLRQVPVGEINLLPPQGGWPTAPSDVSLRAPEWFKNFLQLKDTVGLGRIRNNTAPTFLLAPNDGRFINAPPLSAGYKFSIEPPRMDEFTLSRWCMQAVGSNDSGSLKAELKYIFVERDALLAASAFVPFRTIDVFDLNGLRRDFGFTAPPSPRGPVADYVWNQLSQATQNLIATGTNQQGMTTALIKDLNTICGRSDLYSPARFPINTLPDEIQQLAGTTLTGDPLVRFNRILLETGFPSRLRISWANRAPLNPSAGAKILPHEQAVSAYGIYCHLVDNNGVSQPSLSAVVPVCQANAAPFNVAPLLFSVQFTNNAPEDLTQLVQTTANSVTISVPEGWFCGIEVSPLVSNTDFQRFDPNAMTGLATAGATAADNQYQVFESSWILAESVTTRLPNANDLYNNFFLNLDGATGDIRLTLQDPTKPLADLAFVDTFTISRQRWFWRNRPLLDPTLSPPAVIDDEWRRLAAGGLPASLFAPNPDSANDVLKFDAIAGMDGGLLNRASYAARLPRQPNGAPLAGTILLLVDDRDAINAADYLRYGLTVKSRYASLIVVADEQEVTASSNASYDYEANPIWHRIVSSYRGDLTQIKPLKIFTILPLTRRPQMSPFGTPQPTDPTPFLVVLDEVWFREYGQGERLEAYAAIEDSDVIEDPSSPATTAPGPSDPRPFRIAPLPDHYKDPASQTTKYYVYDSNNDYLAAAETDDKENPLVPLNVFGPFGYTLDQSDDQALANATAYVVYPPANVGPNWWMGVRLRRRLDKTWDQTHQQFLSKYSKPSDVRHFYTRPANLVNGAGTMGSKLVLHTADNSVETVGLKLQIDPVAPCNPVTINQYACALILGNTVADGGLGQEIFVPSTACWLTPVTQTPGATALHWQQFGTGPLPSTITAGRIMLLLLNGTPVDANGVPCNPLQGTSRLSDLWKALLPAPSEPSGSGDCPAMVTGISDQFAVSIGT
jgi:hypothetical protein